MSNIFVKEKTKTDTDGKTEAADKTAIKSGVNQSEEWLDDDDFSGQLAVDVYQTKEDIVVKSTIAGVRPEDIDISINNDMVTIRGKREKDVGGRPGTGARLARGWGAVRGGGVPGPAGSPARAAVSL